MSACGRSLAARPTRPDANCIAAYLAAAEEGSYLHCTYTGDDLLKQTQFPEVCERASERVQLTCYG